MNALELSLYCKCHECSKCPYSAKECRDFMRKYELSPDIIISLLQWSSDEADTTYFDLALECAISPTCRRCKYNETDACHSVVDYPLPCHILTELFELTRRVKK